MLNIRRTSAPEAANTGDVEKDLKIIAELCDLKGIKDHQHK